MKSKEKPTAKTAKARAKNENEKLTYEELKDKLLEERSMRCLTIGEKLGQHIATILLYEKLTLPASITAMCVSVSKFLEVISNSAGEELIDTYTKFAYALEHYIKDDWEEK